MELIIPIITAVITGAFALIGTYFSNRKSAALVQYRLDQVEKKLEIHNNLIERTYKLEERTELQEEKIREVNNKVDEIKRKVN